jgi:alkylation response protein AidB-like acyl-CoA dehydrogenase
MCSWNSSPGFPLLKPLFLCCIDQAVQIHGGIGLIKGSVMERLYRETRPLRIYEGTTEIQKLIISNHLLKEEKHRLEEN